MRQRLNKDLPSLPVWQDRPEIEGGVGWWRQIETTLERGVCVFPVQGPGFDFADPQLPRWMARAHFYALDTQWLTFLAHLQRGCQTTRVPSMAPDPPIGFVQRPKQFEALRALLLEGERKDPVVITTALTGAGGFGKTTLAAASATTKKSSRPSTTASSGPLWARRPTSPMPSHIRCCPKAITFPVEVF